MPFALAVNLRHFWHTVRILIPTGGIVWTNDYFLGTTLFSVEFQ